jgi:hypothetical protein
VAEHGFGILGDVLFQPLPDFPVIAYSVAMHADGQNPLQALDVGHGPFQFPYAAGKRLL